METTENKEIEAPWYKVALATVCLSALAVGMFVFTREFLFGSTVSVAVIITMPFLAFGIGLSTQRTIGDRALVVVGVVAAVSLMLMFTQSARDMRNVVSAIQVVEHAEKNLGSNIPVSTRLREVATNYRSAAANRDFIYSIANSSTNAADVTTFLSSSRQFGFDAEFVAENGLVRPEDHAALYRRALELSNEGNQVAAGWVSKNALASK